MIEVGHYEFKVELVERDEVLFVQIIKRARRGEIERTEINFLTAVLGFDQERQPLRAADERARGVNRAAVIHQQRTGDWLAARFTLTHFTGLMADARAGFIGQRRHRFAHRSGLDFKN